LGQGVLGIACDHGVTYNLNPNCVVTNGDLRCDTATVEGFDSAHPDAAFPERPWQAID
jgi:hypothetical protein